MYSDEQKKKVSDATLNDDALIQSADEHYVWMEKVFIKSMMWTWILNLVTYIAVVTVYLTVSGHEMVYAIYLPLDLLLNMSKAAYYFMHYREDLKREELAAKTA